MPEGHTIHRHALQQRRELAGHRLATDVVQGRFAASAMTLDGRRLDDVEAWGKHLFQWWEGGEVLHVHLGLYGRWRHQQSPPPPMRGEVRLRLIGPSHTWDLSGATACEVLSPDDRERIIARLGPDPLRSDADPGRFLDRAARSRAPIGTLLLDQAALAGIGNVYRAEVLFLGGIHPHRVARDLTDAERSGLWIEIAHQLRLGLRQGRIVTRRRHELDRPASRVPRSEALYVYHCDICRVCATPIRSTTLAARRLDFCPRCQPRRPRRGHTPPVPPP